ncbi:MAG: right-handed parallel beta-helix repeat-containing protein [Bacteroidales bacterium]|nr:right-handed parallel beta-helix repeat-containing protein [Bacteroidales bacterium]MCF8458802.1 right-handed parallel beta-helix repeat-containing protein [Bacteroidales bacterium]
MNTYLKIKTITLFLIICTFAGTGYTQTETIIDLPSPGTQGAEKIISQTDILNSGVVPEILTIKLPGTTSEWLGRIYFHGIDGTTPGGGKLKINIVSNNPTPTPAIIMGHYTTTGASNCIQFYKCSNFILQGTQVGTYQYGIKLDMKNLGNAASGIRIMDFCENFIIENIEIYRTNLDLANHTGPGIHLEQYAYNEIQNGPDEYGIYSVVNNNVYDDTYDGNYEVANVIIRNNYIHDVGGQGMSLGIGDEIEEIPSCSLPNASGLPTCTCYVQPARLTNLVVSNNIIDYTGREGILIKKDSIDCEISYNKIYDYGQKDYNDQNAGIMVGNGSFGLNVDGNWIEGGKGEGVASEGLGNIRIQNNIIKDNHTNTTESNKRSIFIDEPPTLGTYTVSPTFGHLIYHNTIIDSPGDGVELEGGTTDDQEIINNIIVCIDDDIDNNLTNPTTVTSSDNYSAVSADFEDPTSDDYRLAATSTLVDYGDDLGTDSPEYDHDGNFRVIREVPDIGAFELTDKQNVANPIGWTLFSTYIIPTDFEDRDNIENVLATNIDNGDITIIKDGVGQVLWPQYGVNAIGDMTIGEGYQLNAAQACTFNIEGLKVIPENTNISIPQGWSIIGYLRDCPGNTVTMLSNIVTSIIIVKDEAGDLYWPQFNINAIGDMLSGEGYQINMSSSASLTYPANCTKSGIQIKNSTINPIFKNYLDELYINTDNFMIVGLPLSSWGTAPNPGDEIAALGENNQLVGKAIFNGGFTAITIYGDDQYTPNVVENLCEGESFTIEVWNTNKNTTRSYYFKNWLQGDEYFSNKEIAIVGNTNFENIEEPYLAFELYPNPTSGFCFLHLDSNEEGYAVLNVFEQAGSLVFEETFRVSIGEQKKKVDLSTLAQGTYTLLLKTNSVHRKNTIVISK